MPNYVMPLYDTAQSPLPHQGFKVQVQYSSLHVHPLSMLDHKAWEPVRACMRAKLLQLCLTLCHPMDHGSPGSSVHGILQARILEWVAMPSSGGSSQPREWTCISHVYRHWQVASSNLLPLSMTGEQQEKSQPTQLQDPPPTIYLNSIRPKFEFSPSSSRLSGLNLP